MRNDFTIIGIPIDCSGRFIGVERMPVALRAAGLVERLGFADRGDMPVTLDDPHRDPESGIIGFDQVCAVSATIRQAISQMLVRDQRPFVVGGGCTLLIGVAAALRDHFDEVGLAFVDGHLDFYDGASSPTGEAADMDLAILSGVGPMALIGLAGTPPLLDPANVVALGYRDGAEAMQDGASDPAKIVPDLRLYEVGQVRSAPADVGYQIATCFETEPGRFWLYLDLDVLDESVMPAVDYLMPNGLTWTELSELIRPLAQSPALIGVDLTIYNPTLDPTGLYAQQIADFLGQMFSDHQEFF